MTQQPLKPLDLTRWNRAGLERFRYVGANAVTLLEDVRQELAEAFPNWNHVTPDIPETETEAERLARMRAAYTGRRQDWAYEIARSFVRASHILTEHINAFANEGFLSTATQWEYLRRLAAMLDYRPTPPASAATTIALIAKTDAIRGEVKAGLAMKHTPPEGGPPMIFETLADLVIDPALNGLWLEDWNVSQAEFWPFANPANPGWTLPDKHGIAAGQPAILLQPRGEQKRRGEDDTATLACVDALDTAGLILSAAPKETPPSTAFRLGTTRLLADPERVIAPRLNGPDVLALSNAEKFSVGEVIGWTSGSETGFGRVAAVDAGGIRIADLRPSTASVPGSGASLYHARMVGNAAFKSADDQWRFPIDTNETIAILPAGSDGTLGTVLTSPVLSGPASSGTDSAFKTLVLDSSITAHDLHYFDPVKDGPAATVDAPDADAYQGMVLTFDGGRGKLAGGDRLVAEGYSKTWAVVTVQSISECEDSFILTLAPPPPDSLLGVARLHGPFKQKLRPIGYDVNDIAIADVVLTLADASADIPDLLSAGRTVLVDAVPPSADATPFKSRIAKVERISTGTVDVTLDATLDNLAGFTVGNLVLRGNAVAAGHGETKPPLILGNGDAALTGQEFTLERTEVAFIADPALDAGVRAALTVTVDGVRFTEVSSLANSEAHDAHYTVQLTEDRHLTLRFGDGLHGRRLPTGRNNVSVGFRQGTGRAGNGVGANSFEKPSVPHPLVKEIIQPQPASGGHDVETFDGIRNNAPAHLRALDRAVSLADVEYLAASQPGIWHAKAFRNPVGANRRERIELAVVPVDDVALGTLLGDTIRDRLIARAPPGIDFKVDEFDRVHLPLRLDVRYDPETHDAEVLAPLVRDALYAALSLQQRKPGEPIFLSRLYQVVETVPGVVNSSVFMFEGVPLPLTNNAAFKLRHVSESEDNLIWAAWPTNRQVIYLPSREAPVIELSEVTL